MSLVVSYALLLGFLAYYPANCLTHFNVSLGNTRIPRQTTSCRTDQFRCNSGECISDSLQCDGKENCRDGSDEENCDRVPCPGYSFRCNYGACIDAKLECDGKKDCRDNSDETSPKCSNGSRQKACTDFEFRCESGQCIHEDLVCDGKADCRDRSDEKVGVCSTLNCASFTFRCAYGACVNGDAKCNGKIDCADGSDESPTLCNVVSVTPVTPVRPVTSSVPEGQGCMVPQQFSNGYYEFFGGLSGSPAAGTRVSGGTVLQITCNDRYVLVPKTDLVVCKDKQWTPSFPDCVISCASIPETESMYANCTFRNAPISCENPPHGTSARFACKDFYEDLNIANAPFRQCKDGKWNLQFPNCVISCGKKSTDAQTLIVGGTKAKQGDYPWQAAIYRKDLNYKNICGGSLISLQTVISAAHCFAKNNTGNEVNSKNLYKVGVGKYYINYQDPRDIYAQYADVFKIVIPQRYSGRVNQYSYDIAVVILNMPFVLSVAVQPVCVDWSGGLEAEQLKPGGIGIVTGWGLTASGGKAAEELKELYVPYIGDNDCFNSLSTDFRSYFTFDKMCSGYLHNGSSACQGDSGGGLTFWSGNRRHYIRGIVSVAPKGPTGSCDVNQYTLYTNVGKHLEFISQAVNNDPL